MRKELREIVQLFLKYKTVNEDICIPADVKVFLKKEANRLAVLRASGAVDRINREVLNPIAPEIPTRLIKLFKRLYICLKSLDENYPD